MGQEQNSTEQKPKVRKDRTEDEEGKPKSKRPHLDGQPKPHKNKESTKSKPKDEQPKGHQVHNPATQPLTEAQSLKNTINQLNKHIASQEANNAGLQAENAALAKKLAKTHRRLEAMTDSHANLNNSVAHRTTEIQEELEKNENYQQENADLRSENAVHLLRINEKDFTIAELEIKLTSLNKLHTEASLALQEAKTENTQLKDRINTLTAAAAADNRRGDDRRGRQARDRDYDRDYDRDRDRDRDNDRDRVIRQSRGNQDLPPSPPRSSSTRDNHDGHGSSSYSSSDYYRGRGRSRRDSFSEQRPRESDPPGGHRARIRDYRD